MGSTEVAPTIRALSEADLPGALALSLSANWNQNADDWRCMLRLGWGYGVDIDGELAASTLLLPYAGATDRPFAWISMVLVLPAHQRRGLASLLLRHALAVLSARGVGAVLDATPAGHAVYAQEGFVDTWGLARYRREPRVEAAPAQHASRELRSSDWPAIAALDRVAFGADRLPLLMDLARRLPAAARVVERGGELVAYLFGRPGREAIQLGPLVAAEPGLAQALLAETVPLFAAPIYVDLADRQRDALWPWLQQQGFQLQRPFTRMVSALATAPGDATNVMLVAGPELG